MRYYRFIKILLIIILFNNIQLCLAIDTNTDQNQNSYQETEENFRHYTVKKDDTISEIAWTLKVNMRDLIRWNPDINIHGILPGQQIKYKLQKDILMTTLEEGRATREIINHAFTRISELMSKQKTAANPAEVAELDSEIAALKGLVSQNESQGDTHLKSQSSALLTDTGLNMISKQLDIINNNINKISPPAGISSGVIILFMGSFSILFIMTLIIFWKLKTFGFITPKTAENNKAQTNKIEIKTDLPIIMFDNGVKVDSNIERIGVDISHGDTNSIDNAIKQFKKSQGNTHIKET